MGQFSDQDQWSDEQLVDAAKRGDQRAWNVICAKYYERLYRVAKRISVPGSAPEDFVQDAFSRGWEKIDSFRGAGTLFAWLAAIALNLARAQLRRRKKERRFADNEEADLISGDASAEMIALEKELQTKRKRAVVACYEGLPAGQRAVLAMNKIDGWTLSDIAETLGIPAGTARSRSHYALRAMRECLQQKGVIDES